MLAGIDPGAKGGIALLSPDGILISVHDMPTFRHDDKRIPNINALAKLLEGVSHITLERVTSFSKQKGGFTFGMTQGVIVATAHLLEIPVQMVDPRVWQKVFGPFPSGSSQEAEKARKQKIAEKALIFYPEANLYGPRGGLRDGRSDALLIARWGYLQKSGEL